MVPEKPLDAAGRKRARLVGEVDPELELEAAGPEQGLVEEVHRLSIAARLAPQLAAGPPRTLPHSGPGH